MYFFQSKMDFDSLMTVTSEPPYIDDDGDHIDARIVIHPFGKRTHSNLYGHRIVLQADEADDLARQLLQVLADTRVGRYTER